ncbi:MAG: 3-oxoacyl-ACP reductase [Myxococcales bacterium]|nr:3-oxoacyl-ACP reductase [Myxococcales bacterium]MCB9628971.1 3-oxoacyl-ACP reductase [Sandaracinaceae bacterium]
MSDLLLDNEQARKLIKTLGLPLPVPERLRRAKGPYEERPLEGKVVLVGGHSALRDTLAASLAKMGAEPVVVGDEDDAKPFRRAGEAWGRPVRVVAPGEAPEDVRVDAMVYDGTGVRGPDELKGLYEFFTPYMRKLNKGGRCVVIGRPAALAGTHAESAAAAGLEGFTRSLGKEVGANGSTANSVFVEKGAEGRLDATLRFLLSPRSAFVTCQPFNISKDAKGDEAPTTQPLEGKIVLLTGAARGIGESTARIMAAEGAHVVCLDLPRDDEPLSKVARSIGGSVLLADITDPDAPELICKELKERFGGVDIVVHNAGITRDKLLANMKPQLWDMAVDVNLGAVIRITEKMVSNGVLNDGGRVICLSSVSGIAGNRGQTNYSASKAGIVGFVQSLAPQLAARGVTVNAIAPGFIETRLTSAMPVGIREGARRLSALGQGGHPEDVGQAITFLSTPGAVGITGSVLRVCGGALVGA